MKNVLVCIAKDEDHYIEEWINYHLKLGFDDVYVYCNDWNYLPKNKNVKTIMWNGNRGQYQIASAYTDFIENNYNNYDWAFFLDVDEFLNLPNSYNLREFLSNGEIEKSPGMAIYWRFFGDNGIDKVYDNNYSVIDRFLRCEKNTSGGHKPMIHLSKTKNNVSFIHTAHFPAITYDGYYELVMNEIDYKYPDERVVHKMCSHQLQNTVYINHYCTKTKEEYLTIKQKRNEKLDPALYKNIKKNFDDSNKNEIVDKSMYNFYFGGMI